MRMLRYKLIGFKGQESALGTGTWRLFDLGTGTWGIFVQNLEKFVKKLCSGDVPNGFPYSTVSCDTRY